MSTPSGLVTGKNPPLALTSEELAEVMAEAGPLLVGRRLRRLLPLGHERGSGITLELGDHWLCLSIDPRLGRLYLSERRPPTEMRAPFHLQAESMLRGARLVHWEQGRGDRWLRLEFDGPEGRTVGLAIHWTGRSRNVLLLAPGDSSPPSQALAATRTPDGTHSADGTRTHEGTRPADGTQTRKGTHAPDAPSAPRLLVLASLLGQREPVPYEPPTLPSASAPSELPSRFGPPAGSSARVEAYFAPLVAQAHVERERTRLQQQCSLVHKKLQRRIENIRDDLARTENGAADRKRGDLLLAHLRDIRRGDDEVTVPDDFVDGEPLSISLAPDLDGAANAQRYYRLARRADRTQAAASANLATALAELAQLEQLQIELDQATELDAVEQLALRAAPGAKRLRSSRARSAGPESPSAKAGRAPAGEVGRRTPFREYRSSTGVLIWVGRTAADNHRLTFRHARGSDLFLHARDVAGAHVIVRLERGTTVDSETLLDAAILAVRFSAAHDAGQADVNYTLRKNVRPAKGAAGRVYMSESKTLFVREDATRLRRLLTA